MANLFFRTNVTPYRIDTYNALHDILGCRMHFMSSTDPSQDYNFQKIEARCRFNQEILEKGSFLGLPYYKNIWKILKENKPEVVIVPEFKIITLQALAYKFLKDKKVKIVSMCDDSYDMVANGNDFTRTHTMARKIVTPLLDDLLLVDDKVCAWYQQHYNKGIWMPIIRDEEVEIPLYKEAQTISKSFEEKYNLQGKRILLYVGRLAEEKNLPTLIKAIGKTKEEFTTVLIGDGPQKEELKSLAENIDKEIIFAGRYDDQEIRAWYNIGDVFVLPSKQEAFGAVTNEALLGGCYALISNACGSSCLINDKNGKTFDPHSVDDLSRLLDETFSSIENGKPKAGNRMYLTFKDAVKKVINNLK